jgi:predicted nucleotidyltransferase
VEKEEDPYVAGDKFSPDTREFLRLLDRHNVRYLIVGGRAVIYYGHTRLTGDIDIFYERSPANSRRLFKALEEFWDGNIPGIDAPVELQEDDMIIQFGRPPNRIDLISELSGVEFSDAWNDRTTAAMDLNGTDVQIHFIGVDQLIENKERVGRPKDLNDLRFLRRSRGG